MFILSDERPADGAAIERLLDKCFGCDRHGKRSYAYRRDRGPVDGLSVSARARDQGTLLGNIRFWPAWLGGEEVLLLGPLAVDPDHQGEGIGRALVAEGLKRARARGYGLVLLVGDPAYYGRFGFEPAAPHDIFMPGEDPARLQLREIRPGYLGRLRGDLLPAGGNDSRADS